LWKSVFGEENNVVGIYKPFYSYLKNLEVSVIIWSCKNICRKWRL